MLTMLHRLLAHPLGYHLSQTIFAPGADFFLPRLLREIVLNYPATGPVLDVGCGPASWLRKVGGHPVGLDISRPYSLAYRQAGGTAVTGSATDLPFADASFTAVWSIGVFHHLPDPLVKTAIAEMIRVCSPNGRVLILDAVLPHSPWRRPLATFVRRLDRGREMRSQEHLESLLPHRPDWIVSRRTYTINGLEMAVCVK